MVLVVQKPNKVRESLQSCPTPLHLTDLPISFNASQATRKRLGRAPEPVPFPGAKAGGAARSPRSLGRVLRVAGQGNRPPAVPRPSHSLAQHRLAPRAGSPPPCGKQGPGNRPRINAWPGRPTQTRPRGARGRSPRQNGGPYRASSAEGPPLSGRGAAGPPLPGRWKRMAADGAPA